MKATSIHQTGNGASIAPPASGHLTTTPVVSVPFTLIVGANVRGKDPVTGNPTTLLSITDWRSPANYHLPSDVPGNLDYRTVIEATRLVLELIGRLAAEDPSA